MSCFGLHNKKLQKWMKLSLTIQLSLLGPIFLFFYHTPTALAFQIPASDTYQYPNVDTAPFPKALGNNSDINTGVTDIVSCNSSNVGCNPGSTTNGSAFYLWCPDGSHHSQKKQSVCGQPDVPGDWAYRTEGGTGSEAVFEVTAPSIITSKNVQVKIVDACKSLYDQRGWQDHMFNAPINGGVGGGITALVKVGGAVINQVNCPYGPPQYNDLTVDIPAYAFARPANNNFGYPLTAIIEVHDYSKDDSEKSFSVEAPNGVYVGPADGSSYNNPGYVNLQNPAADYYYQPPYQCTGYPQDPYCPNYSSMNVPKDSEVNQFDFYFSPDCSYTGYPVTLDWRYGQGTSETQNPNEQWQLIDTTGSTPGLPITETYGTLNTSTGLGKNSETVGVLIKGHVYRWEWQNVDRAHGVSVRLPFSEYTATTAFNGNCPKPPTVTIYGISCNTGIVGSAQDPDSPGTTLGLQLYVDGLPFYYAPTSYTPAPNGFRMYIQQFADGNPHTFYVYGYGVNAQGVQDGVDGASAPQTTTLNCRPQGQVTGAACGGNLTGYAYDISYNGSIKVDIYADAPMGSGAPPAYVLGTDSANTFTQDLRLAYADGKSHSFYVYAEGKYPDGTPDGFSTLLSGGGPATISACVAYSYSPTTLAIPIGTPENPSSINFYMTSTVFKTNPSGLGPPCVNANDTYGPGPNINYSITYYNSSNNTTTLISSGVDSSSACLGNKGPQLYGSYIVKTVNPGDLYCINLQIDPGSGYVDLSGNKTGIQNGPTNPPSKSCVRIVNRPYFKVYGSGVWAGGGVNSGICRGGRLASWNNDTGKYPGVGAGTQLFALGTLPIIGFASGQNSATPSSPGVLQPGAGLSFANNGSRFGKNGSGVIVSPGTVASPPLGGNLRAQYCTQIPTPLNLTPLPPNPNWDVSSLPSGTYEDKRSTNVLFGGQSAISPGKKITIYKTGSGDVYINQNIVYDTNGTTWDLSGANSVPKFTLIVSGNIYIGSNVTQLDGLYVARKDINNKGGKIYTCADDQTLPTPPYWAPMPSQQLYANCNNQLVVHGSFVADQVNLMRTLGSLRDTIGRGNDAENPSSGPRSCSNGGSYSICAGEVFDFSPELYIPDMDNTGGNTSTTKYEAFTSLPPVL